MAFPLLDSLLIVNHYTTKSAPSADSHLPSCITRQSQHSSYPGGGHITAAAQSIFQTPTQSHHSRVSWGQDCRFPSRLPCSCSCLQGPSCWRQSKPREKLHHPLCNRKEAAKGRREAQQTCSLLQLQSCIPTALLTLSRQVVLYTCDEVYRATGVSREINRFNMGSINLDRCSSSGEKQAEG